MKYVHKTKLIGSADAFDGCQHLVGWQTCSNQVLPLFFVNTWMAMKLGDG